MVVSRDKTPSAQETFAQMAQAAGLRGRILLTVGMLILIRLGMFLPLPGIDRQAFHNSIQNSPLIGFLNIFSGVEFQPWGFLPWGFCLILMRQLFSNF